MQALTKEQEQGEAQSQSAGVRVEQSQEYVTSPAKQLIHVSWFCYTANQQLYVKSSVNQLDSTNYAKFPIDNHMR